MTIEQMAWAFEQLDRDVPIKSIAIDCGVEYSTLTREIYRAEALGFDAWVRGAREDLTNEPT